MSEIAAVSFGQYAHSTSLRPDCTRYWTDGGWQPLVPVDIAEESNFHDSLHS
jgi:hypothetical protein